MSIKTERTRTADFRFGINPGKKWEIAVIDRLNEMGKQTIGKFNEMEYAEMFLTHRKEIYVATGE